MMLPMLGNTLRRYFITGVLALLPIAATTLVLVWLFHLLDNWAVPFTQRFFGHHIPGVGLVITIAVIILAGLLSSNVMGRYFLRIIDTILMDVPVFRAIYNT